MSNDPLAPIEPEASPAKARRKTKAEREAERLAQARAEAEKPIDPKIWLLLGGALLFVGACIFFDPIGFASAGQSQTDGMWIRDLLVIVVGIIGKNPTALVIAVLGGLAVLWGVRGWLVNPSPDAANQDKTSDA